MKTRSQPSPYSPVPFHAVRTISFISSIIVAGILAFFCHQLWADNYKIPWTFIIVLLASLISVAALLLTSLISCCATLSPILNILLNVPILIAWIFGICLLTWNIYGALGHSCSLTNWGNDRGVMVCQIYKTLYSFVVFANLAQIAQIVVDVRARHSQIRLGKYDKMRGNSSQDLKVDNLVPTVPTTVYETPLSSQSDLHQLRDDQPHQNDGRHGFADDGPGWRPGQKQAPSQSYASSTYSGYSNNTSNRHDRYQGFESSSSVQLQDFSYQRPQQSTQYDLGNYQGSYGYQQNDYHQGRY